MMIKSGSEKTILHELAETARERVAAARRVTSGSDMRIRAEDAAKQKGAEAFRFEKALASDEFACISEVKKASPSKGVIAEDFPYVAIAREYEAAGAAALSVLTEPSRFLGADTYLAEIAEEISVPILRKDFIVDAYQLYESKILGASAVLLICALLDERELIEYIGICDGLGLSALVEAHDEDEVRKALAAGARVVGVNNRDLRTFDVDEGRSARLRALVPPEVIFVSESGIQTPQDVAALNAAGIGAALIGETLMRAEDKAALLSAMKTAARGGSARG
jgi:indole-3-glycerol phosphate synthase